MPALLFLIDMPHRQPHSERRTFAYFAFYLDAPMVFLDNAVGQRQAQPYSFAYLLGGKEGIENLLYMFRCDALACV